MSIKPFIWPFTYHDFASLLGTREVGEGYETEWRNDPYGNGWRLVIFLDDAGRTAPEDPVPPGGDGEPADPMVGVCLESNDEEFRGQGEDVVDAYFTFVLRDARGRAYAEPDWSHPRKIEPLAISVENEWLPLRRSEILNTENNILHGGSLHIDAHILLKKPQPTPKAPPSLGKKMMDLFRDDDDKDVSFQVGGEIISAHKIILKKDPSILFSICEENGDDRASISIDDTDPGIFRLLLRYIYAENVPHFKDLAEIGQDADTAMEKICRVGKAIIDAANRFGVVGLKLAIESNLVEEMAISSKSVADWLIFADAKTCPLLKEQATAFFVSRSEDLLNSDASDQLRESPRLLAELMVEIARSANPIRRDFEDDESRLSVRELRDKLMEAGLEIDGDKETLVARLREANREQQMDETE
ncbi:hypothetical protein ACHAXT_001644 [Thalassiosira profunda]